MRKKLFLTKNIKSHKKNVYKMKYSCTPLGIFVCSLCFFKEKNHYCFHKNGTCLL